MGIKTRLTTLMGNFPSGQRVQLGLNRFLTATPCYVISFDGVNTTMPERAIYLQIYIVGGQESAATPDIDALELVDALLDNRPTDLLIQSVSAIDTIEIAGKPYRAIMIGAEYLG